MALVDVAVPTRPTAPHLREAVASVLAQTLDDWQIQASVNGVGGGDAAQILRETADRRVTWAVVGADVGAGENHNRAVGAGHAPYVALLHDDDRWRPSFLETHVAFLEAHRDCAFVFSGVNLIDEDGRSHGCVLPALSEGLHSSREAQAHLYRTNSVSVAAVVMRRAALVETGPFRSDLLFFDHELWLRLAARFPVGVLHRCDADYRLHTSAASWRRRLELGQHRLDVLAIADGYVDISRRARARAHAGARSIAALDAVERGERSAALRLLREIVRGHPLGLLDRAAAIRAGAAGVGVVSGSIGRRLIGRYRIEGALHGRKRRGDDAGSD